jgi:hypothetical protein
MMTKKKAAITVAAVLALASAGAVALHMRRNPDVDLNGLKIGMARAEYLAIVNDPLGFQLAGAAPTSSDAVRAEFLEGKLQEFSFDFYSYKFEDVRDAIKAKYPSMECETVKATADVPFDHERCSVGTTLDILQGKQGSAPGWLMLHSAAWDEKVNADADRLLKKQSGKL